jgi:hypothetical protein
VAASGAVMPRHTLAAVFILIACAVVPETAAGAAAASPPARNCNSADLRYPFQPGGPKTFGVFQLRIAGGPCATAHRVAAAWMKRFETAFRAGRTVVPRSVSGFRFTTLPAREVQAFPERGESGRTTIWFDYRIPNG